MTCVLYLIRNVILNADELYPQNGGDGENANGFNIQLHGIYCLCVPQNYYIFTLPKRHHFVSHHTAIEEKSCKFASCHGAAFLGGGREQFKGLNCVHFVQKAIVLLH